LPGSGLAGISVDLVQLVERASEQLGVMVERRDAEHELKRQYDRLHTTLNELATTREALYHSEKLASIGQLAAGIAHEINNPVAYVLSNFGPLDEYVACMSRMLGLHGRFVAALDQRDAGACDHARSSLEALGREVDLDFVLEDVRSLVTESRQGLLRVKEIVTNLNEFSRRDDVEQAPADINQGLESTLKLLAPKLKSGITVERDLAELPLVRCNLGLLNQVFLNVLQNACMAMEGRGRIRIATRAEGEDVVVAIRDDGPGMPESVRQRIFEPFFTTKPVGEGTGLGLSLCHGIVSRHGGRIEVDTSPGEGTEFRIVVPVSGARKAA
ncbi:MAG: histidine kinase, partial [Ectothiorhodospiraceae bacterium]|nr:histidine kinase [Ectothiorhodospiraceae bacterium]